MEILGYDVHVNELREINLNRKQIINTINAHSYQVAKRDDIFRKALSSSDILLPDGVSFVWAASRLNSIKIKKIAGYDIFIFLMRALNSKKNSKVFFLGAGNHVLNCIKQKALIEFPNIRVDYYSPPFKSNFNETDNREMTNRINFFDPDVLFVGMTAPKQEKWVFRNQHEIRANIICNIGAVFDFYSENKKRPHPFWINLGLEWLMRLLQEPRRLWRRNISSILFVIEVFKKSLFR
ncbi:WecB/TagA/CpsF family glycosyltransferase [Fulvivirga sp. M361]|uniref:WecB/TagA/CpsF family glycosyltransferase n=1 Tax=Fulvivirga sp. M361 TaxID=2594266 RepID=UPI001179BB0A|nr:WecB/TagA/CpsF family glycosyltransferase [Fulvivirga sp. M361]TRX51647.1 WecB/TagA/CpsF family glycosyltransferase [Fulvivirga sp. M361]